MSVLPEGLDEPIRAMMAIRLSDEFCKSLAIVERMALDFEWEDVAEELAQAHHHIHNAIKRCAESPAVFDALDAELVAARADWEESLRTIGEA